MIKSVRRPPRQAQCCTQLPARASAPIQRLAARLARTTPRRAEGRHLAANPEEDRSGHRSKKRSPAPPRPPPGPTAAATTACPAAGRNESRRTGKRSSDFGIGERKSWSCGLCTAEAPAKPHSNPSLAARRRKPPQDRLVVTWWRCPAEAEVVSSCPGPRPNHAEPLQTGRWRRPWEGFRRCRPPRGLWKPAAKGSRPAPISLPAAW